MDKPVIIIGAGGHAKVIADILEFQDRTILGFLDDNFEKQPLRFPLLGRPMDAPKFAEAAEFIFGIGANSIREGMVAKLSNLVKFTSAVHPNAMVANDVTIDQGTVVMAGATINTGSRIGAHCIINTAASVDHDCLLGDFVHVSPGAHLGGTVEIGERSWIGLGGLVINNRTICADVLIGAGGLVLKDISEPGIYVGVPVRKLHSET